MAQWTLETLLRVEVENPQIQIHRPLCKSPTFSNAHCNAHCNVHCHGCGHDTVRVRACARGRACRACSTFASVPCFHRDFPISRPMLRFRPWRVGAGTGAPVCARHRPRVWACLVPRRADHGSRTRAPRGTAHRVYCACTCGVCGALRTLSACVGRTCLCASSPHGTHLCARACLELLQHWIRGRPPQPQVHSAGCCSMAGIHGVAAVLPLADGAPTRRRLTEKTKVQEASGKASGAHTHTHRPRMDRHDSQDAPHVHESHDLPSCAPFPHTPPARHARGGHPSWKNLTPARNAETAAQPRKHQGKAQMVQPRLPHLQC